MEQIDIKKIKQEVSNNEAIFLDVRSPEEFEEFSIPNSINLPVEEIEFGKVPEVERDFKIYVYCMSGARAGRAMSMLKNSGFENVFNLGGIMSLV